MIKLYKKLLALGVGAVVVFGGCQLLHADGTRRNKAEPAIPVMAMTVSAADIPLYITGLGTVQAYNTVTVRPRVDGELIAVRFNEGQDVKKGQVLAHIDSRTYATTLQSTEANLARDEAALANAERDLERYRQTLASGSLSRQQVDNQAASVAILAAAVKGDRAMVENARIQLGYTAITAPIDGRTGMRMVDAGNVVRASDAGGLVVVAQVQPIFATFNMPQTELPRVAEAASRAPLSATAFARDGDIAVDHGTLQLIDNQIDPASGTVRVKISFPNAERKLWPGQFVNLQLRIGMVKNGIAVPARVIQRGDNGPFAFVIRADDTVEVRQLQVRAEDEGLIVVDHGLSAGERVVVDGQLRLRPGTKVKAETPGVIASVTRH